MDDERITVVLGDQAKVRRRGMVERHPGQWFGDWYVRVLDGPDACLVTSPDTVFMVGHEPTGLRLRWDLTYWEARRIALAMQDADLPVPNIGERPDYPDTVYVVEAVVASALMDHYVFPLCNYRGPLSEVSCT